jgi:hypothetical protein
MTNLLRELKKWEAPRSPTLGRNLHRKRLPCALGNPINMNLALVQIIVDILENERDLEDTKSISLYPHNTIKDFLFDILLAVASGFIANMLYPISKLLP